MQLNMQKMSGPLALPPLSSVQRRCVGTGALPLAPPGNRDSPDPTSKFSGTRRTRRPALRARKRWPSLTRQRTHHSPCPGFSRIPRSGLRIDFRSFRLHSFLKVRGVRTIFVVASRADWRIIAWCLARSGNLWPRVPCRAGRYDPTGLCRRRAVCAGRGRRRVAPRSRRSGWPGCPAA